MIGAYSILIFGLKRALFTSREREISLFNVVSRTNTYRYGFPRLGETIGA